MKNLRVLIVAAFLLLPFPAAAQQLNGSLLKDLPWRAIGPAVMGGRIDDVAVVAQNPSIIYVGTAAGGVWKTVNNGTTWESIFDHQGVASIGDVAVAPSNENLVWVGTGEANNRQSSSFGDGIYKSTDGGKTWKHMGLLDTQAIGRIVIDPADPDIVYVAAAGHLWGPNKERGLYKTVDGGITWTNTMFINEDTGFSDVAMDSSNRHVLYAAAYMRRRTAFGFAGAGPYSGIFKTIDGGKNWKKLTAGLPGGITGRIGLDVSPSKPAVVYATVEHRNGGVFRSQDFGETWQRVNTQNPRPMYYSQIRVDPNDPNRIYVLGASFLVSSDGGQTFADPESGKPGANVSMTPTYDIGVHGDHHAFWIDPKDSNHLVLGGDGGLYLSYDRTVHWIKVNNFPIGQFYAVAADMNKPYYVYGGMQDTHSWRGPSATRHQIGILNSDWSQIDFGDGMFPQVDPGDPNTVYIEANDGAILRVNAATGDRKSIKPFPKAGEPPYRFNWTAPLQISPHNSKTVYLAGNRVFKSTDRGETWTFSPDLTKSQDRDKLSSSFFGVPLAPEEILSRNDGVSAWGTISALAESPVSAQVIWAGTDDGNLQVSRDGGKTWTNVADKIAGLPPNSFVSRVEPAHQAESVAYVAFDRHRDDDFAPYVFMTADFGQTWKSIAGDLPKTGWVNVVKQHPRNPNLLFVGTETGLFVSNDNGTRWIRFENDLPTVPVRDILIHPRDNDLILATHGRSIYILDDISPLEGLTTESLSSESYLFQPRPATIFQFWKDDSYSAQNVFAGPNPPPGAILNYYLKTDAGGDVKIRILDSGGSAVRELDAEKSAGIHRIVWDLRLAPPKNVQGARGPFVLPGKYTAALVVGGKELTRALQVEGDPLFPIGDVERKARQDFLLSLNKMQAAVQNATSAVRKIDAQMSALGDQLKQTPNVPASVSAAVASIQQNTRDALRKIAGQRGGAAAAESEGGFSGGGIASRVNGLAMEIDGDAVRQGTMTGPTAVQKQRLSEISAELNAALADINKLITSAIPELNSQMIKGGIPRLIPPEPVPVKP